MRPSVADIFLSYAREDIQIAQAWAVALESLGWSIFWDRSLSAGQPFRTSLQQQLDSARCVLVLWSNASILSPFVIDEAEAGLKSSKLIPVLIEAVEIPLGFGQTHTTDLTEWDGRLPHDKFERFAMRDVSRLAPLSGLAISYSTANEAFAMRLKTDLQSKDVRCWLAPRGNRRRKTSHDNLRVTNSVRDRLLLVLSKQSMSSWWIKAEIAEAVAEEFDERRRVLFMVGLVAELDPAWIPFMADRGQLLVGYKSFAHDFSNWTDAESYRQELELLVKDLTRLA